jgi:group I intron endonuclease
MNSGIYRWCNTINNKCYIGSAEDLEKRRKRHLWLLAAGKHHSIHFQRAWNIYGSEAFVFEILELCPVGELLQREQKAIDAFDAIRGGYNVAYIAGSPMAGRTHTEQTKKQMSENRLGKSKPDGFRDKISKLKKGVAIGPKGNKKAWENRRKRELTEKEKTCYEAGKDRLRDLNQSDTGRAQAGERTKKRWETGAFDVLREENSNRFQSEAHRKLVSASTTIWNQKRTPEFNQWCARKAQAARRNEEFIEPRPNKMYID